MRNFRGKTFEETEELGSESDFNEVVDELLGKSGLGADEQIIGEKGILREEISVGDFLGKKFSGKEFGERGLIKGLERFDFEELRLKGEKLKRKLADFKERVEGLDYNVREILNEIKIGEGSEEESE